MALVRHGKHAPLARVYLPVLLTGIIAFVSFVPSRAEGSWYEETRFACSDPLDLVATLSGSTWFSKGLSLKAASVSQGLVYVTLTKKDFDSISLSANRTEIVEAVPLTTAKATTLRQILTTKQENASVPYLVEAALTGIPGYFVSWSGGLVLDAVFSRLFADLNEISVTARVVRELVAPGGTLSNLVTTGVRDDGEYLIYSYLYTVQVGDETRRYMLSSCAYAVKLLFQNIETIAPLNNKRLIPSGESTWRVFDVQDSKFDPGNWMEVRRDKEYIYLENRSPSGLVRQWRVSMRGGKWQSQREDGTWGTLYAQTVAS